jgi:hypothetical protein
MWWLASVPVVTFGLGTWQVYRLQWKQQLLRDVEDALRAPPQDYHTVADPAGAPEPAAYRRVRLQGTYDHTRELFVGPRVHNGALGVHVVTPLRLASGCVCLCSAYACVPGESDATVGEQRGRAGESRLCAQGAARPCHARCWAGTRPAPRGSPCCVRLSRGGRNRWTAW